jgi:hypothetical protein
MTTQQIAERLLEIRRELDAMREHVCKANKEFADGVLSCAAECVSRAAAHTDVDTFKRIVGSKQ